MKLGDAKHSGPTRLGKAAAEADLIRMRSVASRAEVPRVVAELHSEAAPRTFRDWSKEMHKLIIFHCTCEQDQAYRLMLLTGLRKYR